MSPQYFGIFVYFVIQIILFILCMMMVYVGSRFHPPPIDVWHLSIFYRYVDILSGDRMIVCISISVKLATGFGGFMPSHSLAPVTIPQIGS